MGPFRSSPLWSILACLPFSFSLETGLKPASVLRSLDFTRGTQGQVNSTNTTEIDAWRADKIRDGFKSAMDGYFQFAFPKDELRPLSNTGIDRTYGCGWGLSVVDALGTAIVMELEDIVEKSLDFIDAIDFTSTPTNDVCSVFEINVSLRKSR